ncbi:MAG: F0F1 ATP synthase subunit A [Parachlamydiaceae bacterium]|nr:F0F1 ATP synthase subunit A [Parachlamydiaceae bacterium]
MIILGASDFPEVPTFVELFRDQPLFARYAHFLLYWEDILFSGLVAILLSLFFYFGARKREMIPHGIQNFFELIVDSMRKLVGGILGKDVDKHLPFLATLFIYIFVMNAFGLVPFMKSPSSSVSISIGMGLCVFAYVQYLTFTNMGFFGYLHHLCGSPQNLLGWILVPLMLPIEIITQISRPITLALRLTGNMMGEHVLISISALFAVILFSFDKLPFGLPIQVPAMLFGLVTSFIQGLVFTLLSAVYIFLSKPHASETHT